AHLQSALFPYTTLFRSRAVVSWDTIKTATHYDFAVTTSDTPPPSGTSLFKTSELVNFLDDDKTYYAHVRANCNTVYSKSEWTTRSEEHTSELQSRENIV